MTAAGGRACRAATGWRSAVGAVALVALLAACGSGGSGDSEPTGDGGGTAGPPPDPERDQHAACTRTATPPPGGATSSAAGGAQATLGTALVGLGGVSPDGCSVYVGRDPEGRLRGDEGWIGVGDEFEVGGGTAMLVSVERRAAGDEGTGTGGYGATFWFSPDEPATP
ncbi:hypothetical protein [Cellulomonas gilvus]|uniref:hypothetical protein n=1 Tax=Cellulomonas gilvus TaxID=11 RepID=UPI0005A26BF1|nr:hypothetical protein [Cellulomonas gilvus]